MNPRGGYRPDPEVVRQRRAKFHMLKAARGLGVSPLPLKTNNRQFLPVAAGGPGIGNQWKTGRCEGFAHASGFTVGAAMQGTPIPPRSPDAAYTMARILEQPMHPDGELPTLVDEGTEPSLILQAAQIWGVASIAQWGDPNDVAAVNRPPTVGQLEASDDFRLKGAYFLTSHGEAFCRDLMTALAPRAEGQMGFPCTGAIAASSAAFNNYTGGVLGPLDDDVDHATLWIDYEWDGVNLSSLWVYGVNSWGTDWGEDDAGVGGGMYRCNAAFVQKYAQDCAVLDVTSIGRAA